MNDDVLWDLWWTEVKYLAPTDYIEEIMKENICLYRHYYELGWTPLEVIYEEWG